MRSLTVLFLIYYIYKLFNQNKPTRKFTNKYNGTTWKELGEKTKKDDDILFDVAKYFGSMLFALFVMVIEFIYICNSFTINKTVALAFLTLWLSLFTISIIKAKVKSRRNKDVIPYISWKLSKFIINIVDVAFFGYMFYALMIK